MSFEAGPAGPTYMGKPFTQAMHDVLAERMRQISVEGWTPAHDDYEHEDGELERAAACYALQAAGDQDPGLLRRKNLVGLGEQLWPWDRRWWKPYPDARRMLVKAAALLIAAIERIDRAPKGRRS